jgi:hypothetical protein
MNIHASTRALAGVMQTILSNNYIKSMGVSLLLDDAMNNTESWRMRYLTDAEKQQWQVFGTDRLEEERLFNQIARSHNITRTKFIKVFKSNYKKCLNEAKALNMTIFECASLELK